ncbi:MAG: hypothetical protein ACRDBM_05975, partial [Sporomusa sp.]
IISTEINTGFSNIISPPYKNLPLIKLSTINHLAKLQAKSCVKKSFQSNTSLIKGLRKMQFLSLLRTF